MYSLLEPFKNDGNLRYLTEIEKAPFLPPSFTHENVCSKEFKLLFLVTVN